MKYQRLFTMVLLVVACMSAFAQNMPNRQPIDKSMLEQKYGLPIIFPLNFPANESTNTGEIYLGSIKNSDKDMVVNFFFAPNARNYWHSHPDAEQGLLILEGEAYYQEEGKPKQLLKKGDYVVTPPNTRHWNGATEKKACVCITVSDKNEKAHAEFFRAVTEEEFLGKQ